MLRLDPAAAAQLAADLQRLAAYPVPCQALKVSIDYGGTPPTAIAAALYSALFNVNGPSEQDAAALCELQLQVIVLWGAHHVG
jgi:hypothetical protein